MNININRKIMTRAEAINLASQLGDEFAVVQNPDHIHPPYEIYPLAQKINTPRQKLAAALMDMDGTLTTTEELCLHSLEFMIRRASGRQGKDHWKGLDHIIDYPHIIGNSTTKHVEFLIRRYNNFIQPELLIESFIHSVLWTLILGFDQSRKDEVKISLRHFGLLKMLEDSKYIELLGNPQHFISNTNVYVQYFLNKYIPNFKSTNFTLFVRAGIDIYYQRYHEILEKIKNGDGEKLSIELLDDKNKRLIEPMPGVGPFIAMTKGWLGEDAVKLFDFLVDELRYKLGQSYQISDVDTIDFLMYKIWGAGYDHNIDIDRAEKLLGSIATSFEKKPIKLGVATSSILYEADIVLREMFNVVKKRIDKWNISDKKKEFIKGKFSDYTNVFDGIVTASDSNEIRLKPHRDLYSIALNKLGIPKEDFDYTIGFEDSESGITAIRASGIGLAVAVPFNKTQGHNLEASAYILQGGLPEAILIHHLFLKVD